ncbi:MAG: ABC transporter ATP-binding protein [Candidatus Hermodarchaeota archaeon]
MNNENLVVKLENVIKTYQLGEWVVKALNGCSMEVQNGEMVAILGPSGSGKSTLLNICGGLDRPDSGKVSIVGQDLEQLNPNTRAEIRKRYIGFIFQFFQLFDHLSAAENIEYPLLIARQSRQYRKERVKELLELVDLMDRGHHKPSQLSGGQRQRVAIARALANKPKLVLADEPTGNLDSDTGRRILDLLVSINKELETAFIIVTHDSALSDVCPRNLHLLDGQFISETEKRSNVPL